MVVHITITVNLWHKLCHLIETILFSISHMSNGYNLYSSVIKKIGCWEVNVNVASYILLSFSIFGKFLWAFKLGNTISILAIRAVATITGSKTRVLSSPSSTGLKCPSVGCNRLLVRSRLLVDYFSPKVLQKIPWKRFWARPFHAW